MIDQQQVTVGTLRERLQPIIDRLNEVTNKNTSGAVIILISNDQDDVPQLEVSVVLRVGLDPKLLLLNVAQELTGFVLRNLDKDSTLEATIVELFKKRMQEEVKQ